MSTKRKRSIFDLISEYLESLEEMAERSEGIFIERPSWNQKACAFEPLRNVMVTPTEVVVTVDLPLTEENTVQVKPVEDNALEISARMKRTIRLEDFGITHHRGEFQAFHCQMLIPVQVHMDKMRFKFKKGILEIHLPRKHEYTIPLE